MPSDLPWPVSTLKADSSIVYLNNSNGISVTHVFRADQERGGWKGGAPPGKHNLHFILSSSHPEEVECFILIATCSTMFIIEEMLRREFPLRGFLSVSEQISERATRRASIGRSLNDLLSFSSEVVEILGGGGVFQEVFRNHHVFS